MIAIRVVIQTGNALRINHVVRRVLLHLKIFFLEGRQILNAVLI